MEGTLHRMLEKYNIYFKDCIIRDQGIVAAYTRYLESIVSSDKHQEYIIQHTGSVYFDIYLLIACTLKCILLNTSSTEDILTLINNGQIVNFKGQRHIFNGYFGIDKTTPANYKEAEYIRLDQPGKQNLSGYIPRKSWNKIQKYNGTSKRADGTGLRKENNHRSDFISHLLGIETAEVPSNIDTDIVVVANKDKLKELLENIKLEHDGTIIKITDLVPASYYTDGGDETPYGYNMSKSEAVIKVVANVSTAREIIIRRGDKKTVGFVDFNINRGSHYDSELLEILERESLNFAILTTNRDAANIRDIVENKPKTSVFICTKTVLEQSYIKIQEKHKIAIELESQVRELMRGAVEEIVVDSPFTWDELSEFHKHLYNIAHTDGGNEQTKEFIVKARSVVSLIITALFPLSQMADGCSTVSSHNIGQRIKDLWAAADRETDMVDSISAVVCIIDDWYKEAQSNCKKQEKLEEIIMRHRGAKMAIVVPKGYYADYLHTNNIILANNIDIVTPNRMGDSGTYDLIITAGEIRGSRFDLLSPQRTKVMALLYDIEYQSFQYKKRELAKYERKIHKLMGLDECTEERGSTLEDVRNTVKIMENLDHYTEMLSIQRLVDSLRNSSDGSSNVSVYRVGKLSSGEQILFTKHYKAAIFDPNKQKIIETEASDIQIGDIIIFIDRGSASKSIVEHIYNKLRNKGQISDDVAKADYKIEYWKTALLEYKKKNNLTYKDLAEEIKDRGVIINEQSIGNWVNEGSHVVGPRNRKILEQVTEMIKEDLDEDSEVYYRAFRTVRTQRTRILKYIGRTIVNKLQGIESISDDTVESIITEESSLSVMLEVFELSDRDGTEYIPAGYTNRPIGVAEVFE